MPVWTPNQQEQEDDTITIGTLMNLFRILTGPYANLLVLAQSVCYYFAEGQIRSISTSTEEEDGQD